MQTVISALHSGLNCRIRLEYCWWELHWFNNTTIV